VRDLDRWKDKVELSLDGRQIFFLFFGSAVAACLIFVVGVLIGKRLEARALAMQPPAVEDPLAALDQLGDADEAAEGLTYHKALTRPARLDEKRADAHPAARPAVEPVAEAPRPAPAPKPEAPARLPSLASLPAAPSPMPPLAAGAMSGAAREPRAPLPAGKPQVVAAAQPKKPDAKPAAGPRFTLQLSAFPERADAEEFMRKIQSAGYKPFLVASEIPGKGTFWRVRVGDYASKQAAADAKIEFERKQRMIAYVARL